MACLQPEQLGWTAMTAWPGTTARPGQRHHAQEHCQARKSWSIVLPLQRAVYATGLYQSGVLQLELGVPALIDCCGMGWARALCRRVQDSMLLLLVMLLLMAPTA